MTRAWVYLLRHRWSAIAIVPIEPCDVAREVAAAAAETSELYAMGEIHLVDAHGASVADAARLKKEAEQQAASNRRAVVLIDPPLENAGGMSLLCSAEAALVLVRLGVTALDSVARIVEIVGRERVLGCITYR